MFSTIKSFAGSWLSNVLRLTAEKLSADMPSSLVTRRNDEPYFYRYYFKEESEEDKLGVVLHKFVGSDPLEEVHSHPWDWAISIILSAAYLETKYKKANEQRGDDGVIKHVDLINQRKKLFLPFDINVLLFDDMHRVDLQGDAQNPCWTIFIHGPRRSTWGFANEKTGDFREVLTRTRDRAVKKES